MPETESDQIGTQRRRSERIQLSVPLIVRGTDLLGQPFEERSSTVVLNLHGCRYSSKHHLPKNTWVTLEVARGAHRRGVRARVAWIQRPHSVREMFQIAVELEAPINIWHVDPVPADWASSGVSIEPPNASPAASAAHTESTAGAPEAEPVPTTLAKFLEDLNSGAANPFAGSTERASQKPPMPPADMAAATEEAAAGWRERLEREMGIAQAQWNELLQSSLDGSIQRLAERLSERSQEALRNAGETMSAQLAGLREPLAQASAEARDALGAVKQELEQEMAGARSALAEIEQLAGRMKDYSAQLEAASHDTLNELHRRLENILETRTKEMNQRADAIAAEAPERLAAALESLGHQVSERTLADVESKLVPHLDRVSGLLGEMSAREAQADEGLRLHRERLRQILDNNRREADAQMAASLANIRDDFEKAREEALLKCNDELESGVARASHAAVESISRASEWLQEEARARLQVQVEQTLAAGASGLEEKTGAVEQQFRAELEENSSVRLAQIRHELDGVAGELAGRTRTQIAQAAETAAATFGQVLSGISEREARQFTDASRGTLEDRTAELERFSRELQGRLEAGAGESLESFRAQIHSHLEAGIAEGRGVLAGEFATAMDMYRAEREAREKEWAVSLDRLSAEIKEKYQERFETACDSWMASSVRRLDEQGQAAVESIVNATGRALRDSCSMIFGALAAALGEPAPSASGVVAFAPAPGREATEPPPPLTESATNQLSA
ncbi:MAG: hypothetical protein WA663_02220 [Candidatus Acidiferrales bacterium]